MSDPKNPALSQEPRYEPAIVIPLKQEASLLDWLKANNRLIPRESLDKDQQDSPDDVDELLDNEEDFVEDDDFDDED
ncbi:MAG: DUF3134 domain-containing protein [Xenococcaceae cyanobacterium MO_207.B15]|nr:DUF3134 domain-containing protein [Xenococcaceae cyanobacterium MO_207.B15]MDJ0742790.1 DUF3134 domain-containing protein [Xenococcaceae cyanobacterium MO_167.B27]